MRLQRQKPTELIYIPIYTMPPLRFPWLVWYDHSLNEFTVQIDGALILDCGYIWKEFFNPRKSSLDLEAGAGVGAGFRFILPSLKRAVCLDIVLPIYPEEKIRNMDLWPPPMYLYLDLPF